MMKNSKTLPIEVAIVGAGAAGLACAAALREANISFVMIEARDRIGGRAHSLLQPQGAVIEYGAEFIHGAHHETLDLLDEANEPFIDLWDEHLFIEQGKKKDLKDFWEKIERCNSLLNGKLKIDRSIADFIAARGRPWGQSLKDLYISYIEGFQAADIHKAGERGMAASEKGENPELNSQGQFRPIRGYGSVMEILRSQASLSDENLYMNSELLKIKTHQKAIELSIRHTRSGRSQTHFAKRIVLTVPLPVLRSSIEFEPGLPELRKALSSIEMGHVQRITFQFKDRFWERLSEKPVGFLHTGPEFYFPTWWTQMPARTPYLTAWQGGPRALEMSSWPEEERVERALKTLAALTKNSVTSLKKKYVQHFTHDWSADPYSLGAYSYSGLSNGRKRNLQRPFMERIYLAGEATRGDSSRGTIHGALASGALAAQQILKALKKKSRPRIET